MARPVRRGSRGRRAAIRPFGRQCGDARLQPLFPASAAG
jgi:hypothetical protein